MVVAHTFSPSSQEAEAGTSLSSRSARATPEKLCLWEKKQKLLVLLEIFPVYAEYYITSQPIFVLRV